MRDEFGAFRGGVASPLCCTSPLVGEAAAAILALVVAQAWDYRKICMESKVFIYYPREELLAEGCLSCSTYSGSAAPFPFGKFSSVMLGKS
ncbi:unnamed protein product [Prunus armeniaca]|uniref:Uncharacterized protein n=1 Tax=Prunus armeniaca TaxID=36596 RepID=A0A6J5X626_PRUAR|nr:unnamed protein product [Prunus armeniaca]CAB4308073.1 unnamed protein product [Prunus armeniaca]